MNNKYLNGNPIGWLMEPSDPSIRYLLMKYITNDPSADQYYSAILETMEIRSLFREKGKKILGNTRQFDIYYSGSMWCFAEAIERGLDIRTEEIEATANFLIHRCQLPSGGFTLNWNPPVEVACRTGDMIKYLILAGYNDDNVARGINWILQNQRHDYGWLHCPLSGGICNELKLLLFKQSGNGLMRENDETAQSCIFASIACAMALSYYIPFDNSGKCKEALQKAATFLINNSLFIHGIDKNSCYRCHWNSDFTLLGYPVLSQYDILYGLHLIARAGLFKSGKAGEAFNLIMSKQNEDGTWNLENHSTGMLFGNYVKKASLGKKNKWVTLHALRLLAYDIDYQ